jgi:hypothetical protein
MICFYFLLSSRPLSNNFKPILGQMAYNVPAVYDVLAARTSKCAAFAGRTKCGGATAWEWSVAE